MAANNKWIMSEGYEDVRPTVEYKSVGYKTKKSRRSHKQHSKFWAFIKANPKGTD